MVCEPGERVGARIHDRASPGKRRAGEKLNLWLKLSGDLKARLGESGQAILLNGRGTGAGLRYDKLHAFDTTGREIEARMKLTGDQVRIEVADEGAIYPVTIDPTLTQQQKLEASDAGAADQFGLGGDQWGYGRDRLAYG